MPGVTFRGILGLLVGIFVLLFIFVVVIPALLVIGLVVFVLIAIISLPFMLFRRRAAKHHAHTKVESEEVIDAQFKIRK